MSKQEEYLNPLGKYRVSDEDTTGTISYFGFLAVDGSWYIHRRVFTDQSDTYSRYAEGRSGYRAAWTARATQTYKYFNELTTIS